MPIHAIRYQSATCFRHTDGERTGTGTSVTALITWGELQAGARVATGRPAAVRAAARALDLTPPVFPSHIELARPHLVAAMHSGARFRLGMLVAGVWSPSISGSRRGRLTWRRDHARGRRARPSRVTTPHRIRRDPLRRSQSGRAGRVAARDNRHVRRSVGRRRARVRTRHVRRRNDDAGQSLGPQRQRVGVGGIDRASA